MKKWKCRKLIAKTRRILRARREIVLFLRNEINSLSYYFYILPEIQNALKFHKGINHSWKNKEKING